MALPPNLPKVKHTAVPAEVLEVPLRFGLLHKLGLENPFLAPLVKISNRSEKSTEVSNMVLRTELEVKVIHHVLRFRSPHLPRREEKLTHVQNQLFRPFRLRPC